MPGGRPPRVITVSMVFDALDALDLEHAAPTLFNLSRKLHCGERTLERWMSRTGRTLDGLREQWHLEHGSADDDYVAERARLFAQYASPGEDVEASVERQYRARLRDAAHVGPDAVAEARRWRDLNLRAARLFAARRGQP